MMTGIITEKTMKRYDIFKQVHDQTITLVQASQLLGLCYRHVKRLYARYKFLGLEGLVKHYGPGPEKRKLTSNTVKTILDLRKTLYDGFNILHFQEKLAECHQISLSYETLRKLMIQHGLHKA